MATAVRHAAALRMVLVLITIRETDNAELAPDLAGCYGILACQPACRALQAGSLARPSTEPDFSSNRDVGWIDACRTLEELEETQDCRLSRLKARRSMLAGPVMMLAPTCHAYIDRPHSSMDRQQSPRTALYAETGHEHHPLAGQSDLGRDAGHLGGGPRTRAT